MHSILLVEDDSALRSAYEMILGMKGFKVKAAENGQVALDYCKHKTYDLILLDIMMPVLDGVGFLKKANLSKTMPKARLIVFSNLSSGDEVDTVKRLGAHQVLLKANLTPNELVAVVTSELTK